MARCLIVGCGCRGIELGRELRAAGHTVRGTTRDASRSADLEAAGIEPFVADPDRVGTLAPAFAHVGVVCVLLGSAAGSVEQLAALHGPRLGMLLERMLDTTVRGIVYEASGDVDAELLEEGARRVRLACERSLIPYALLTARSGPAWPMEAARAVQGVLLARAQPPRSGA
ncbi:MAG: hypothetical protein ACRDNJ_16305 [Solirubrobacteraceae bacterium]